MATENVNPYNTMGYCFTTPDSAKLVNFHPRFGKVNNETTTKRKTQAKYDSGAPCADFNAI
jgi:hypothetical protein